MRRTELEHVIRAAAAITDQYEIVIIGSQSILGAVPELPAALVEFMEADVYPTQRPDLADLIDGAIGEGSPFHERFGYSRKALARKQRCCRRVGKIVWCASRTQIQISKIGLCLEPHDLAASELAAGREKDWPFVAEMLRSGIVGGQLLEQRLRYLPVTEPQIERLLRWVNAHCQFE